MIKIIAVSDFPFLNSGIYSCLLRITRNYIPGSYVLYSDQNIDGFEKKDILDISVGDNDKIIVFTHIEYTNLYKILKKYKNAVVYVCDWPGVYWDSVKGNNNLLKGLLGKIRFYYRIRHLPRNNKYVFVAEKDCSEAIKSGFLNSRYLPLGVEIPTKAANKSIDTDLICFTGNFRYEPNLNAAVELIGFAKDNKKLTFIFAGFYAQDLNNYRISENVKIFENVPSIINLLVDLRPIYVSNLKFGAGAKNKILEAIVSACPIIATSQSLDNSLLQKKSILQFNKIEDLLERINLIKSKSDYFNKVTLEDSKDTIRNRSWGKISKDLITILNE